MKHSTHKAGNLNKLFQSLHQLLVLGLALGVFNSQAQEALPAIAQVEEVGSNTLAVALGQQKTLALGQAPARVAVGNPAVLDVKVLRSAGTNAPQLLLTAKGTGASSLVVWPKQGGHAQRWEVQVSGPQLVLDRKLGSVLEHASVLSAYRPSTRGDSGVLDRMQVDVKSNTVQVDVQVVEFKKSAMKKVGLNFNSNGANDKGFNFGLFNPSTSAGASPFADAMNLVLGFGKAFSGAGLAARLSLLEGNGLARILARPTLVAHSGQSASFLAGGELPIPVSANDGNVAIEYKEFGIKLQLTPTVLSNERIALKVAPESSDLDFSNAVAVGGVEVPAIRTRRADTMVELSDGESFVIGGLVSRSTSSNVNKIPLLGDLPILGTFFKNLNYTQDETELVIVVTPTLVHPLPVGTNLEALLPGGSAERRNAGQVWADYLVGKGNANGSMPGFSH